MGYIKLVPNSYPYPADVENVIEYVCSVMKCNNMVYGGRNLIGAIYEPSSIANQFLAVQYRRNCQKRIYHVIVSFDSLDAPDLNLAYRIGNAVINMYPDYQSVFAVHENTENLHLHILFNNCPVNPEGKFLSYSINQLDILNTVERYIDYHLGIPVFNR